MGGLPQLSCCENCGFQCKPPHTHPSGLQRPQAPGSAHPSVTPCPAVQLGLSPQPLQLLMLLKMSWTLWNPTPQTDTLSPSSFPSICSLFFPSFFGIKLLAGSRSTWEMCVLPSLSQAINLERYRMEFLFLIYF